MRTVSFQGSQISAGQRRQLDQMNQVRQSFLNSQLQAHVTDTLAAVEKAKEQGIKPPKQWTTIRTETGTRFLGDVFGF